MPATPRNTPPPAMFLLPANDGAEGSAVAALARQLLDAHGHAALSAAAGQAQAAFWRGNMAFYRMALGAQRQLTMAAIAARCAGGRDLVWRRASVRPAMPNRLMPR